jgi:hypothetical protein
MAETPVPKDRIKLNTREGIDRQRRGNMSRQSNRRKREIWRKENQIEE